MSAVKIINQGNGGGGGEGLVEDFEKISRERGDLSPETSQAHVPAECPKQRKQQMQTPRSGNEGVVVREQQGQCAWTYEQGGAW